MQQHPHHQLQAEIPYNTSFEVASDQSPHQIYVILINKCPDYVKEIMSLTATSATRVGLYSGSGLSVRPPQIRNALSVTRNQRRGILYHFTSSQPRALTVLSVFIVVFIITSISESVMSAGLLCKQTHILMQVSMYDRQRIRFKYFDLHSASDPQHRIIADLRSFTTMKTGSFVHISINKVVLKIHGQQRTGQFSNIFNNCSAVMHWLSWFICSSLVAVLKDIVTSLWGTTLVLKTNTSQVP